MRKLEQEANLRKVKLALAAKCDRLAKVSKSATKRAKLLRQAARFRRQASDLSHSP